MTQTIVSVGLFLGLLAMLPLLVKWLQGRAVRSGHGDRSSSRVVSALAVGPHQRVVTVEVGPPAARVWLVLGVTAQSVSCLHSVPAPEASLRQPTTGAAMISGAAGA